MRGRSPGSRHASAHNYALHQVCGARGMVRGQLHTCVSLTPAAREAIRRAEAALAQAEIEIRSFRIEPDGSIKEFRRDK